MLDGGELPQRQPSFVCTTYARRFFVAKAPQHTSYRWVRRSFIHICCCTSYLYASSNASQSMTCVRLHSAQLGTLCLRQTQRQSIAWWCAFFTMASTMPSGCLHHITSRELTIDMMQLAGCLPSKWSVCDWSPLLRCSCSSCRACCRKQGGCPHAVCRGVHTVPCPTLA